MSTTAETIHVHRDEISHDPSRYRSVCASAPVTIEAMDETNATSGLDSTGAEASAQTLGQLGAQFAHDFNNVLAVVLTSVEMAMRVGDPAKANLFLANALKIIARGRTLTDRLAAASYACEAPAPIDAHAVIRRVLAAASKSANVTSALDAGESTIRIDARFFEEAVRNLIANAIASGGAVTVSTRNATGADIRGEAGRDYLVLDVRDTGRGMADEVRHQAFDLFFTTDVTEARRGIGLSQAKDTARRAGGIASMESAAGQGTTVTLAIPLASA
jgi:signal transduction histidine kinase